MPMFNCSLNLQVEADDAGAAALAAKSTHDELTHYFVEVIEDGEYRMQLFSMNVHPVTFVELPE